MADGQFKLKNIKKNGYLNFNLGYLRAKFR